MIVRQIGPWWRKLFWVQGSALARTWRRMLVTTLLAFAVTIGEIWAHLQQYSLTSAPFVLLGVAISIVLGFRNSAAYDRWWEGRKLWGRMVNVSRSFCRQLLIFLDEEESETSHSQHHPTLRTMYAGKSLESCDSVETAGSDSSLRDVEITRTIAFVHSVRHFLRDTDPAADLERLLSPAEISELAGRNNVPMAVLEGTGRRLREARRAGRLTDYQFVAMEESFTEMTSIQGGLERIKKTPLPFSYTVLTHRIVLFYCIALPFGLIQELGYLTPVVVLLISHTFFGLEAIGDEIEDPFGTDANDLPLDAICATIESDLRQSKGDSANLPTADVVDEVLL